MPEELEKDWLSNWKPGKDICIVFDDKLESDRTSFQIDEMFSQIKKVVNDHGFDLNNWGLRDAFERRISKQYIIQKMDEAIEARDEQLLQKFPKEMEFLKDIKIEKPELKY